MCFLCCADSFLPVIVVDICSFGLVDIVFPLFHAVIVIRL
jgi:hypothetical protein